MVELFREIRRVLKPTGTVWLNYGDCYATSVNGRSAADTKALTDDDRTFRDKPFSTVGGVLKPKDLCMAPNRLAIALQEDGWWIRSEIIWAKANPMPESIPDRPATSHEKIFFLTKRPRYFYDAEAVRQGRAGYQRPNAPDKIKSPHGQGFTRRAEETRQDQIAASSPGSSARRMSGFNERWNNKAEATPRNDGDRWNENAGRGFKPRATPPRHAAYESCDRTSLEDVPTGEGRNLRNYEPAPLEVWAMATQPFSEGHFATFPVELVKRALQAGCPQKVCSECGKPWVHDREVTYSQTTNHGDGSRSMVRRGRPDQGDDNGDRPHLAKSVRTVGYGPTCDCAAPTAPGRVLDPFGGSGTVAIGANTMSVDATLIELNPDYAEMARRRVQGDASLFADVRIIEAGQASEAPNVA